MDASSSIPTDLADEITSINAIYGDDTLSIHQLASSADLSNAKSTSISASGVDSITLATSKPPNAETVLLLSPPPSHPLYSTPLLLSFPPQYPQSPCRVVGTGSVAAGASVGAGRHAAEVAQRALGTVFLPGEACVFALLTELENSSSLGDDQDHDNGTPTTAGDSDHHDARPPLEIINAAHSAERHDVPSTAIQPHGTKPTAEEPPSARFPLHAWTLSEPVDSHKSVFLARAIYVQNAGNVADATAALLELDKHVSKATHNIRAWRLRAHGPNEPSNGTSRLREHQECDDDGEAKAGARVLGVMAAMDVWNVLVVVSRWYGGVKLGPERFRIIGQVARDVLLRIGSSQVAVGSKERDEGRDRDKSGRKGRG